VQASTSAVQDTGPAAERYSRFHAAVSRAQLTAWLTELTAGLPARHGFLVDISGPAAQAAKAAACAGHTVLRVVEPGSPAPGAAGHRDAGQVRAVTADANGLEFLADGCADGVIAEDRTLSRQLAAEALVGEIARVLRPGGSVLACVDSLTFGMGVLAEQHRWPHLVDVPNADVVLVPWPDGSITRCYGAEQLRELFTGNRLEVSWIRPRTVFSPQTVSYLLARDPGSFGRLVTAELSARSDDSVGAQLIISARRRQPPAGLPPTAVALGLTGHASRGGRARLKTGLGHLPPAVDALPVAPVFHAAERRQNLRALCERRLDRSLVPVRLGQIRTSVTRLGGPATV
jgi:SAM-dependent methyltransferase